MKFSTPSEAEKFYGLERFAVKGVQTESTARSFSCCGTQTDISMKPSTTTAHEIDLKVFSQEYASVCEEKLGIAVPGDFLVVAGTAMAHLAGNSRSNVLYSLAKGIGTMREDNSDSLFPVKRMPMGLVEYTANFFTAENLNQVSLLVETVSNCKLYNCIICIRFHDAQMITGYGSRQCIVSLGRNGPSCIMALCGVCLTPITTLTLQIVIDDQLAKYGIKYRLQWKPSIVSSDCQQENEFRSL